MQNVWENVQHRVGNSEHVRLGIYNGSSEGANLVGACFQAEQRWIRLPKWTKAEFRKIHEAIAARALQLSELLTQIHASSVLLDLREYIEQRKVSDFGTALEEGGLEDTLGLDNDLEDFVAEALPPMSGIMLKLHKRALEQARRPYGVSQPNSPNAKLNFFIQHLSNYFQKAYAQPLHAHVATIVSAIFDEEVDEDRVRALLRTRRRALQAPARKKLGQQPKRTYG